MILEIIKWYSIIFLIVLDYECLCRYVKDRETSSFTAVLLPIPIIIYLIVR